MPSSTDNVKLGVCSVTYNSVDLGYTKGGVEVEVATETHEVMVDQFGNTPVKEYITGRTCTVRCPLAETTIANLVAIMPGATLITDGTDTTSIKAEVVVGISTDLQALAQKLVLHPIANTASDFADDFTIPLAGTGGAMSYAYKLDEERVYNVEFKAYPASGTNLLFVVGDESATP